MKRSRPGICVQHTRVLLMRNSIASTGTVHVRDDSASHADPSRAYRRLNPIWQEEPGTPISQKQAIATSGFLSRIIILSLVFRSFFLPLLQAVVLRPQPVKPSPLTSPVPLPFWGLVKPDNGSWLFGDPFPGPPIPVHNAAVVAVAQVALYAITALSPLSPPFFNTQ